MAFDASAIMRRQVRVLSGSSVDGNVAPMALSKKKATTIAFEPEMDALLTLAAEQRGVSRAEFVRQQLALVLEQYRRHPKPEVAGIIRRTLKERGNEAELYADRRR